MFRIGTTGGFVWLFSFIVAFGSCVMGESSVAKAEPSNRFKEQPCKFGTVVRALWPDKPALNLAQRAGLSERGAQYLIDGKRKPNARAIHAVNGEMLD